jgi:hypothetical protein
MPKSKLGLLELSFHFMPEKMPNFALKSKVMIINYNNRRYLSIKKVSPMTLRLMT